MKSNTDKKTLARLQSKEAVLLFIFIGVFVLMSVLSPTTFLTWRNLQSMAFQLPELGIFAIAMMVVIVSGGMNLSITYTAALSSIIGGLVLSKMTAAGIGPGPTILAGIATFFVVGLACGALNGVIVADIGIAPMLATLGTSTLFEGICLNITKGGAISGFPDAFLWFGNATILGVPFPMIVFVVVVAAAYFLMERSPFGFKIYMIGCNPTVTSYSGVNVKKNLHRVYLFSALLCAIAGILMSSRYNSAKESYGSSYMMQSISAAVLGGTDISGGYGRIFGTVLAVMIIQVISSGLNILGVNRFIINVIMGGILILVLTINFISSGRKANAK
ncbi:MAG: ABC transporter permease [Spirochaetaceae bacterium]|nr:ABC transporter permease [Spirochaetaceae bacterium]